MLAESVRAVDGHFERRAELTHPILAEPSQTLHQDSDADAFDQVEVDTGPPWNGILTGVEHDLAW